MSPQLNYLYDESWKINETWIHRWSMIYGSFFRDLELLWLVKREMCRETDENTPREGTAASELCKPAHPTERPKIDEFSISSDDKWREIVEERNKLIRWLMSDDFVRLEASFHLKIFGARRFKVPRSRRVCPGKLNWKSWILFFTFVLGDHEEYREIFISILLGLRGFRIIFWT